MNTSEIRCPTCFGTFRISQALYRCVGEDCPGRSEKDEELSKFLGSDQFPGKTFLVEAKPRDGRSIGRQVLCPDCDRATTTRVCPHCHCELPSDVDRIGHCIVSVHGGTSVGKSTFIKFSIPKLGSHLRQLGFEIRAATDGTADSGIAPIWPDEPSLVPANTLPGQGSHPGLLQPLVYRVNTRREVFGLAGLRRRRSINLVVYDSWGGGHENARRLQCDNKSIPHAAGLIILVDPLSFAAVRDERGGDLSTSLGSPRQQAPGIIERIIKFYRDVHGDGPIKAPTAFVVTKLDQLRPLAANTLDPQAGEDLALISQEAMHRPVVDTDHLHATSAALKRLLRLWGGGDIVELAEGSFPNHAFLTLSSLGDAPIIEHNGGGGEHKVVRNPQPARVADPWLWLLYRLKSLDGN